MKDALTNETLTGICGSNFELTNYAIDLGRYYIKSGHETSIEEILRDVRKNPNPDYVETLKAIDEQEMKEDQEQHERGR